MCEDMGPGTFLESVEAKLFLEGLNPAAPPLLKADSSNHEGTSCCACHVTHA